MAQLAKLKLLLSRILTFAVVFVVWMIILSLMSYPDVRVRDLKKGVINSSRFTTEAPRLPEVVDDSTITTDGWNNNSLEALHDQSPMNNESSSHERKYETIPDREEGRSGSTAGLPADSPTPVSPSPYIHQPRLNCSKPNTYLVYVYSDVRQKLRRELIRKTWARPDRYNDLDINVHVFFVVGTLDHNATTNTRDDVKNVTNTGHNVTNPHDDIERQLLEEIEQYHDILVCDVIDSYRNLTLKGLAVLGWINSTCDVSKVDFVFKTDDDVYVNLRAVFLLAKEAINSSAHFLCIVNNNSTVYRHGKWAVPKELFSENTYPPYCSGGGYGMTQRGFVLLLSSLHNMPYFPIEDSFFTRLAIMWAHPDVEIKYFPFHLEDVDLFLGRRSIKNLKKPGARPLYVGHPVPNKVLMDVLENVGT